MQTVSVGREAGKSEKEEEEATIVFLFLIILIKRQWLIIRLKEIIRFGMIN